MTVLVAVLIFMANLALSAPLPLPQDVIATTTLAEPELASLIPALDFLSTFVFGSPTQVISIPSPAASSTSSAVIFSQTTNQTTVLSLTSSSAVQQETEPITPDQTPNNNENVQTEVTHGPVTFGELTTPSEGGTFNKFVENDGTNSSITGETATSTSGSHSFAHASTFAANTLASYALFTQSAKVYLLPTGTLTSKSFSTHPPAPSPTSKVPAVNYNRPFESHEIRLAKRLFPSLFKDNEGFDRFDVPGFSHGNNNNNNNNNNGKDAGQTLPPNVVSPGVSLFEPPPSKGSGKGSGSGNNNANNEDGNGSDGGSHGGNNASNSSSTNDLTFESNPFPLFPSETSAGLPPGLFLPPTPRGLTREPPEP